MKLKSGEIAFNGFYEYKTTLSEGEHLYYFTASDSKDTNTSESFTTSNIQKPKKVDEDGAETEGLAWVWLIVIIVIVIVSVLILVFLLINRKKKEPETIPPLQPEMQELIVEPAPPPVSPEPPALAPQVYPGYQTEEPVVQDDLYTVPPEQQGPEQFPAEDRVEEIEE